MKFSEALKICYHNRLNANADVRILLISSKLDAKRFANLAIFSL